MNAPNLRHSASLLLCALLTLTACEQPENVQTPEDPSVLPAVVDCDDTAVRDCCLEVANKAKDGVAVQLIDAASGQTAVVIAATFTNRSLVITGLTALPIQPGPAPRKVTYKVEVAPSSDANFDNGGNAIYSTLIDLSGLDRAQDQLELIVPMPDGTLDQGAGAARRKIRGLMADEQK